MWLTVISCIYVNKSTPLIQVRQLLYIYIYIYIYISMIMIYIIIYIHINDNYKLYI